MTAPNPRVGKDTMMDHDALGEVRPFTQFMQEQRKGALHEDLSEALAKVVQGVMETGKVGALTVSLKIKPTGDGMVQVFDDLKSKVPEHDKPGSIFFTDAAGNVTRRDPRQTELPLREVPDARGAAANA